MILEPHKYYHLYNRSNGGELIFQNSDNYLFFLRKFRTRFKNDLTVVAYCLMPTHFHFLIKVTIEEIELLKKKIGRHLSSYTKAFNNAAERHGSLFQQHTKAKLIDDEDYLMTLIAYIHQNPIRANLVDNLSDWPFSSYRDLAGFRNGTLVSKEIVNSYFSSEADFRTFSKATVKNVKKKYWV